MDNRYQHRDFSSFVNARLHPVSNYYSQPNADFFRQYKRFLSYLSFFDTLKNDHYLEITCALMTQDRLEEAEKYFERIDPEKVTEKLQYDYLRINHAFFKKDTKLARQLAERYQDYPILHWRKRFAEVLNQLNEIEGNRSIGKEREPVFAFKLETDRIILTYHNITDCRINIYTVDIELLFSKNPFSEIKEKSKPYVAPNHSFQVELPQEKNKHEIEIPQEFKSGQIIVEVQSSEIRQSRMLLPNQMDVLFFETHGQLEVLESNTGKPLPEVYVKVYYVDTFGDGGFYKDGYTDLRGRFDYSSCNHRTNFREILFFSILILSEEHGVLIKKAHGTATSYS